MSESLLQSTSKNRASAMCTASQLPVAGVGDHSIAKYCQEITQVLVMICKT